MPDFYIDNVEIVQPGSRVCTGTVLVRGERIARLGPAGAPAPQDADRIDGRGKRLTPGLVDVHTHGIGRLLYERGPEDIRAASRLLPRYGTTCAFPTLVPRPGPRMAETLAAQAESLSAADGARMPGLHIEGPFMALTGAACPTLPGDTALADELIAACRGRLAVMSLSPETPDIVPVIERLCEQGVVPFITHTAADDAQTQAAIDAGARHATHFYDVFQAPPVRDPGVRPVGAVEVLLADPRATVDFICDGCHVKPVVIRMALAAKGFRGIVAITDSNIGAGLPPGVYDTPWGYPVRVAPGDGARIAGEHPMQGALAGSALTMNAAMANLDAWLALPPEQLWALGTLNPAELVRQDALGRIEPDAPADLVLWNADFTPARTWVRGQCLYDCSE